MTNMFLILLCAVSFKTQAYIVLAQELTTLLTFKADIDGSSIDVSTTFDVKLVVSDSSIDRMRVYAGPCRVSLRRHACCCIVAAARSMQLLLPCAGVLTTLFVNDAQVCRTVRSDVGIDDCVQPLGNP